MPGIEHRLGKVREDPKCPKCGYVDEGVHLGAVLCPYHDEAVVME
jgi:uncharacterized Zn finger protein (UPF0148 family)